MNRHQIIMGLKDIKGKVEYLSAMLRNGVVEEDWFHPVCISQTIEDIEDYLEIVLEYKEK